MSLRFSVAGVLLRSRSVFRSPGGHKVGLVARALRGSVLTAGIVVLAIGHAAAAADDPKRPGTDSTATNTRDASPPADVSPAEKQRRLRLRQIAEGYKANRASLAAGTCRIELTSARARTIEDAFAGVWEKRGKPFEITVVFRGDAWVMRTKVDQQNSARKGVLTLWQNGNSGTFRRLPDSPARNEGDPFSMVADLASVIAAAEAHNDEAPRLTEEKVLREEVEYIRLSQRGGGEYDVDFFIDRRRGYLPIVVDQFRKQSPELVSRTQVLETREEGSIWFPIRVVSAMPQRLPDGTQVVSVQESKTVALDLTTAPEDADLTISVPAEVQYTIEGDNQSAKSLFMGRNGPVTLSVNDLEGIHRALQEVSAARRRGENP